MGVWAVLLVAATALHAGFQLTVSLVVYPALARTSAEEFGPAHERHSRAIAPLVAFVYGSLVVGVIGALVSAPSSPLVWVAGVAGATAVLVTALRAAPLHAELGRRGPDRSLLTSLTRADRVRTLAALVACAAAMLEAAVGP